MVRPHKATAMASLTSLNPSNPKEARTGRHQTNILNTPTISDFVIPKTPHVPTLRRHLSSQALSYRLCLSPDKIMGTMLLKA